MSDATLLTAGHATHAKIIAVAMIAACLGICALRNATTSEPLTTLRHQVVAHRN